MVGCALVPGCVVARGRVLVSVVVRGMTLVPSWQGVAGCRTRSEYGKAEKGRKGCKPFNRVKLWQAVKPII